MSQTRNHNATVVFPAAGLTVLLAWAIHTFTSFALDAEAAAGLTAVLAYAGAKFEGHREEAVIANRTDSTSVPTKETEADVSGREDQ